MKDDQLDEFIKIYNSHFDENINREEALKKANKIIRLIKLLYFSSSQLITN